MNWINKFIEWLKIKLFGFNTNDIEIDTDGNIKSIKFNFYFEGKGWNVKNLILFNDNNHLCLYVGDISNDKNNLTEITLPSDFINFENDFYLKLTCDFTCDDGEVIKVNNAKIKLDSSLLTIDTDTNKIVYKLTATNLGLKPIVFGNMAIENYIKAEIL